MRGFLHHSFRGLTPLSSCLVHMVSPLVRCVLFLQHHSRSPSCIALLFTVRGICVGYSRYLLIEETIHSFEITCPALHMFKKNVFSTSGLCHIAKPFTASFGIRH